MSLIPVQEENYRMSDPKQNAFTLEQPENVRRRRIVSVAALIGILIVFGLISYFVGRPLVRQFQESPETFRDHVKSYGVWGPVLMIGMRALQVIVAIIPGEVLEVASGFVFGWFWGMILCLIGTTLAVILIYLAVRKWGVRLVEAFFPREKILQYSFIQNEKKLNLLVFILFLIPGTPKDLISYFAGLTRVRFSHFLVITLVARIPSVITSTWGGDALVAGNWPLAIGIFLGTGAVSLVGLWLFERVAARRAAKNKASEAGEPEVPAEPLETVTTSQGGKHA